MAGSCPSGASGNEMTPMRLHGGSYKISRAGHADRRAVEEDVADIAGGLRPPPQIGLTLSDITVAAATEGLPRTLPIAWLSELDVAEAS